MLKSGLETSPEALVSKKAVLRKTLFFFEQDASGHSVRFGYAVNCIFRGRCWRFAKIALQKGSPTRRLALCGGCAFRLDLGQRRVHGGLRTRYCAQRDLAVGLSKACEIFVTRGLFKKKSVTRSYKE